MSNKFKKGDRVKYTSNSYGDEQHNPMWGGKYGKIVGTVTGGGSMPNVTWDNGNRNGYYEGDLEKASTNVWKGGNR